MDALYIGVDVGTGSARAGVFDRRGTLLGVGKTDFSLHQAPGGIAEQSSGEIWLAVCASVRAALDAAGRDPAHVEGIGFDATCSLVVLGPGGAPLPVGDPAHPERDVIVWMDHRARAEAAEINTLGHRVLDYVGGAISPEMETPKLLWLKRHRRAVFDAAWQFFDLADFLTWRATGSLERSICTVTCKWTYLAHEGRWDRSYFEAAGLAELTGDDFARIGARIVAPGTALGSGLNPSAAAELGLRPGIAVAAGLIDAHAGGVGTIGAGDGPGSIETRMAYVFGTSACTMASTQEPAFVKGVWGPYDSAMVPGLWLLEGGQSAAGAAIDHLVRCHPFAPEAEAEARNEGEDLVAHLGALAENGEGVLSDAVDRIGGLHVVPEFMGNRAPFADPEARAVIAGLGMERDRDSLVGLYIAGIVSLGYGVRQILDAMAAQGVAVDTIVVSGGAARSDLVRQLLADATGVTVAAPETDEPVLLGSAILGAVASGAVASVEAGMAAMSRMGRAYAPSAAHSARHAQRFAAFERLQAAARDLRAQ